MTFLLFLGGTIRLLTRDTFPGFPLFNEDDDDDGGDDDDDDDDDDWW